MLTFTEQRIAAAKVALGASDLTFDLTGVTLTIDGRRLFLPIDAIRALSGLMSDHEAEVVRELRQKMQSERR